MGSRGYAAQAETRRPRSAMTNLVNNRLVESAKPRARQQVKRSLSELAPLPRLHQHLRHHPGRGQHDARGLLDVQAPLHTRHSISLFRPTALATAMSPDGSRRSSFSAQREDPGETEGWRPRAAQVPMELDKASVRADALRQSLSHLDVFATETTKQLDDSYYAVLEKMSTLQTTVTAIKSLADGLHDLCEGFDRDSRALESDTVSQLAALGRFEEQETKIGGLQTRVRDGRVRIQGLTDRVDTVRKRIEGWERADRDWQEKTRKRLKIFWSVTSVVAIFTLLLAVGVRHTTTSPDRADQGARGDASSMHGWLKGPNHSESSVGDGHGEPRRDAPWKTVAADNDQLRVFDEL